MEITLTELSKDYGLTVSHLCQLIKRGILPEGRKDGRCTYLPESAAREVLGNHEPGAFWKPVARRAINATACQKAGIDEPYSYTVVFSSRSESPVDTRPGAINALRPLTWGDVL